MAALRAAAEEAFAGRGALVFLVGEAGIGKTRCAEELRGWARTLGAAVRLGRCPEEPGAPPFAPWLEILRAELQEREPAQLRERLGSGAPEVARFVPELRGELADPPPPPRLDPSQERFRLFQSLAGFWRAGARERPLLLVLDDLHRADEPSLKLLRFLGDELGDLPLLVVACLRGGVLEGDPVRAPALAGLLRLPRTHRIALPGLSVAEVAECLEALTGVAPGAERLRTLHEQTGGNPFFLTRVVPLLKAEGAAGDAPGPALLPRSVRDAIAEQVRGLPPPTTKCLEVAAVLGREFSLRVLALATARREAGLRQTLVPSLDAGILLAVPARPLRFRFAHILVRDALYEALPARGRARWHARIARALARSGEGSPPELAHHFAESCAPGDLAQAIAHTVRAARWSAELLAHEEAARHYRSALELLERKSPVSDLERGEILLGLAEAELRSERHEAAAAACEQAAELARRLGAREMLARAALLQAPGLYIVDPVRPDSEPVVRLLREAARALSRRRGALRTRVVAQLAMIPSPGLEPAERRALSREAIALAEDAGDSAALALARGAACLGPWDPARWREREARLPEALRLAEAAGDREFALALRDAWIAALLEAGEVDAADREIETFAREARELRHPRAFAFTAHQRSTRALMEGRFGDAERLSREYLELASRIGDWAGSVNFALKLMVLRWQQGRAAEAEVFVETLRELAVRHPAQPEWRCGLALAASVLERREEARAHYGEFARARFATLPKAWFWLLELVALSDVCVHLGDAGGARVLYRLLLPYRERLAVSGRTPVVSLGSVARALAVLAELQGRGETAAHHFETALSVETRSRSWPCRVRTQYQYARMLSRGGSRERARCLATAALDSARKLGMQELAGSLESLRSVLPVF
jgi:tetratricopeptide (TPR) repeat protein